MYGAGKATWSRSGQSGLPCPLTSPVEGSISSRTVPRLWAGRSCPYMDNTQSLPTLRSV